MVSLWKTMRAHIGLMALSSLDRDGGAKRLICFRKKSKRKPWILEFLWRDICATDCVQSRDDVEFFFVDTIELLRRLVKGCDAYVLVFDSQLALLHAAGIPLGRIILYYPHVRAGLLLPGLKRVHAILCLNHFERALCLHEGVDVNRIHVFPAGYSAALFDNSSAAPLSERPRDVLFVARYVTRDWSGAYPVRKRYEFLCSLANALALSGRRVAILGPGWSNCEYELLPQVELVECDHDLYPEQYQQTKLVCSVSAQEGGPVSFVEGLASGCLLLSTPSGFASEFCSGKDGIWLMPLSACVQNWLDQVTACLSGTDHDVHGRARRDFLQKAEFEALAFQLLRLCFP